MVKIHEINEFGMKKKRKNNLGNVCQTLCIIIKASKEDSVLNSGKFLIVTQKLESFCCVLYLDLLL